MQLELLRPWTPPDLMAREWRVVVTDYPAVAASAMLVRCRLLADGVRAGECTLTLRAMLWRDAWAARQPLTNGADFDSALLEVRRVDFFRDRDALPATVGTSMYMFARSVGAGHLLTWRDVARRPLVRKGDLVEVTATDGQLRITMKGLALQKTAPRANPSPSAIPTPSGTSPPMSSMKTASKYDSDACAGLFGWDLRADELPAATRPVGAGSSAGLLAMVVLLLVLAASAAAQSLWPASGVSELGMYADRKAGRTGDILTVIVAEAANASNTQSKTAERKSSVDDSVSRFLSALPPSRFGTHNGELPGTSFSGSSSQTGGGQVNNSQSITARTAVLVTDVLPNGNLVIEGVRVVTFSGETQYVVLHGIVRPDDISPGNSVLSSSIAGAGVEFISEGSLTRCAEARLAQQDLREAQAPLRRTEGCT